MPGRYFDERADQLRERYLAVYGGATLPVAVESIAGDLLGLRVREQPELGASGLLIPARREIWLDAGELEFTGRRRFTIAHELGHWICQVCAGNTAAVYCRAPLVDEQAVSDPAGRDLEREANVFAAELLMPQPLVVEHAAELGPDPVGLGGLFGVSTLAMHWRLFNLGIVETRPATAAGGAGPAGATTPGS